MRNPRIKTFEGSLRGSDSRSSVEETSVTTSRSFIVVYRNIILQTLPLMPLLQFSFLLVLRSLLTP